MNKPLQSLRLVSIITLGFVSLSLPILSYAHTGVGDTAGFGHGLAHPFTGLDHLLAMIAVGLWAAQMGGRALWLVPFTFVSIMALGSVLGMSGLALPFFESGILLSLLVLGVLIAATVRLALLASCMLVAVFALFHGYAHGSELPSALSAAAYATGFLLTTALLHLLGVAAALLSGHLNLRGWVRYAGGLVALSGGYLMLVA